jgi:PAS domain S-box-containing protein
MLPSGLSKGEIYRLLVQEVKDYAIYLIDPAGLVATWNKGARRSKGYRKNEIIGHHFSVFYTEEDRLSGLPARLLKESLEKGRTEDEGWRVRKDGSKFWASVILTTLYDNEKVLIGYSEVTRDLTEREKEKADFKLLAETVPQLVWTANEKGNAENFNQRWTTYSGLQPERLKGMEWINLVHPDEQQEVRKAWLRSLEKGKEFKKELRLRNKVGDYFWYLNKVIPVTDTNGVVFHWFGTATDIHDQKIENEKKEEFIGFASHELRSPITTIKAYIHLIERCVNDKNDCDANEYLRKTHGLIDRLNNIVSEMHEITKAEAGKLYMQQEEFNLGTFITEFAGTMREVTKTHRIELEGNADITVCADKNRMLQVLTNYLSNAIKYSPKADKVTITVSVKEPEVEVGVTDYGIGVPEYKRGKVFSKFYRANNAKKFEGLGLGLYLVKQIIHLHKGRVWFESEEGKGSTFYFTLPVHCRPGEG